MNLMERFEEKVYRTGNCWFWIGARVKSGYGHIKLTRSRKNKLAHIISWETANGRKVPEGLEVMHICDLRQCVNPAHLELGTTSDNHHDAANKGLYAYRALWTHCPKGHLITGFTPSNGKYPSQRYCKECKKAAKVKRSK
jgi:HNH endonuclease